MLTKLLLCVFYQNAKCLVSYDLTGISFFCMYLCEKFFILHLQVFDVRLNHQFVVIKDLDIYDKVGYGVAHDEYVPFSIKNGKLNIGQHSAPFSGSLFVEVVKVSR